MDADHDPEIGLVQSADGSLADPYDMAMAQMQAHMMLAEDGDDLHSLDGASGHSDEELRIIMDPESRTGFVPVAAKVARGGTGGASREGSGKGAGSGVRGVGASRTPGGALSAGGASSGSKGGKIVVVEKENRSRARPRKPHEPDPFLSIDTLPTTKKVVYRQSTPSRERHAGSKHGSGVAARKKQESRISGRQTRAPPGTPSHPVFNVNRTSRSRNASSAVSSDWNPLVPRQKPLTGSALENPVNTHVKVPFKHNVNKPNLEKVLRPMSPGQTMKERTMLATFHLARTMARQRGEEEEKPAGRLLKGRLKPLYPVKSDGPGMQHCRGVVAEENKFMAGESRTVARRRKIMAGMVNNKDFLYERPQTAESLHNTSVASDLSDGREKDLDEVEQKQLELPTPPHDGIRMPPNSLASASDPNFRHNLNASASQLSSDVFEIDEIPKTSHSEHIQAQSTIQEVSSSTEQVNAERPSTSKSVHFAENQEVPMETNSKEEEGKQEEEKEPESKESCKPNTEPTQKKEPDNDPDGNGGGQGDSSGNKGQGQNQQGQTEGQAQDSSQGQGDNQGQTGGTQEADIVEDGGHTEVDETGETDALRASHGAVLFTSQDLGFRRMGTVLPTKKSAKKKQPSTKHAQNRLSSKSAESISDMSVVNGGRESPTKDYFDQQSTKSRPQTAEVKKKLPQLLRRPASASVPYKGTEPQVQFVIRPNGDNEGTEQLELEDGKSPRLNEIRPKIPLSARTQTSGVPSHRDPMEPTIPRVKLPEAAIEFKVEGSKMEQVIRAGVCTECGKSTTKIAEYWQETGALVCDVCNRQTRAEEDKKIDWIRKQMSQVYRGGMDKEGNPTLPVHMLTENGENTGLNNLNDLESALNAVHSEINEAIQDMHDDQTLYISEDEDSADSELLALTNGEEIIDTEPQPTSEQFEEEQFVLDEEAEKMMTGQMSKVLTQMDVDPNSLSEYEMRVYWYQKYAQAQERESSAKKSKEPQERIASANKNKERAASAGKKGRSQDHVQSANKKKSTKEEQERKLYENLEQRETTAPSGQNSDPVSELLQQGAASNVQHFKGQRIPALADESSDSMFTDNGNLGVAGKAKKLLRPPSAKKTRTEAIAPFAPLCFQINARPPPGYLYYFAYGADMNPDRMASYVQRSVVKNRTWGLLYGFQLVFNKRGVDQEAGGFPNIQFESGGSVEGCLYLITLQELDRLDRHVGYPQHYDHAMLPVWLLNSNNPDEYGVAQYCVPALVLVAKDEWIHKGSAPLCTDYAVQQCVKGGGDVLSPAYQEQLTALTVS